MRCGARDMTDYQTLADGNESGPEDGAMARYVFDTFGPFLGDAVVFPQPARALDTPQGSDDI